MWRRARTRSALALAAALATAAAIAGCTSTTGAGDGRLQVVATTTQVGDLVRQIAGDKANVTQILQPGSDPHESEPRPGDALAVAGAKLVFSSGGDVDGWLGGVLAQAGGGA